MVILCVVVLIFVLGCWNWIGVIEARIVVFFFSF